MKKKSIVLLLGGYDPTGAAGLLADVAMLEKLAVPYVAISLANTTQCDGNFLAYHLTDSKILKQQIDFYLQHYKIKIIKIGMLGSANNIDAIIALSKRARAKWIIWDPIYHASAGKNLIGQNKFDVKLLELLDRVDLVTPNLTEAKWMQSAATSKLAVLIKGGHSADAAASIDYLHYQNKIIKFSSKRLSGKFRGTGCRLASLIAGYLYLGHDLPTAVGAAKKHLYKLLKSKK